MNWKKFIPEVIKELNEMHELPKRGILAGGAISNKIWEKITGISMPINDIDIFIYESHIEPINNDTSLDSYKWSESEYEKKSCGYAGIRYTTIHNKYYSVNRHERIELLNNIYYSSNTTDPNIFLESFDINCTQVGYDLETGEICSTSHFNEFIKTGELKVVCANTPAHTLIRLLKKREEFKVATLDKSKEFTYLKLARTQHFHNYIRHFFGSKYFDIITDKWRDELREHDLVVETVKDKEGLWTINTPLLQTDGIFNIEHYITDRSNHVDHLVNLSDLDYFMRNIHGDKERELLWSKLGSVWADKKDNYMLSKPSDSDVELISDLIKVSPQISISISKLDFNRQVSLIKNIMKHTSDVDTIAILSEEVFFETDEVDEDDILLFYLRARKTIHNMEKHRVKPEAIFNRAKYAL